MIIIPFLIVAGHQLCLVIFAPNAKSIAAHKKTTRMISNFNQSNIPMKNNNESARNPREEAINHLIYHLKIGRDLADKLVANGIHSIYAMAGVEIIDLEDCGFTAKEATLILSNFEKIETKLLEKENNLTHKTVTPSKTTDELAHEAALKCYGFEGSVISPAGAFIVAGYKKNIKVAIEEALRQHGFPIKYK